MKPITAFMKTAFAAAAFAAQAAAGVEAAPAPGLPVIIDADTGRDDTWAILGAMKTHKVEAVIATYGNVPLDRTVRNALDVVALGLETYDAQNKEGSVPVLAGEAGPIAHTGDAEIARRADVNGNGLCNLVLHHSMTVPVHHAARWQQDAMDIIRARGRVDYLAAGPLTNLARLVDAFGMDGDGKPAITHYIDRVLFMGGSIAPGLAVDFNMKADPAAALKVFETFGARMVLVPYDETRKLRLEEAELADLKPANGAASFSKALMQAFARGWSPDHGVLLHDPALLPALDGTIGTVTESFRVVQSGDDAGKLVRDPDGITLRRIAIPAGEERRVRDMILHRYLDLD